MVIGCVKVAAYLEIRIVIRPVVGAVGGEGFEITEVMLFKLRCEGLSTTSRQEKLNDGSTISIDAASTTSRVR